MPAFLESPLESGNFRPSSSAVVHVLLSEMFVWQEFRRQSGGEITLITKENWYV